MAVGIKRSALVGIPCKIEEVRFCPSCEIVTERELCPCCETQATVPHPERGSGDQHYCTDCADGFEDAWLRVKTWSYNPYDQSEGDLVFTCKACLEEEAEQGNTQAVWKE